MKNKIILPLILINMLFGVGSVIMIAVSGGSPIWIGSMMATIPLPFFLMIMTNVFGRTRTTARLPLVQLLSLAGLGLVLYALYGRGEPPQAPAGFLALVIAVIGAVFVQWYVWVYSSYGRKKSAAIVKGKPLPELQFKRLDGTPITSASFAGSKTLMVFFRANWCPFCMGQLKEVLAKADRLEEHGVKVKFISNQSIEHSQELAKKLNLTAHFEILRDADLRAAKALGIEDIGGTPAGMSAYPKDTVKATVIALAEDGAVIFGDETDNYRVRPHPDTFMHVFQ
ncbi:MAG: redoxin domain-containing protein [Pseudomonadota bacterium]